MLKIKDYKLCQTNVLILRFYGTPLGLDSRLKPLRLFNKISVSITKTKPDKPNI